MNHTVVIPQIAGLVPYDVEVAIRNLADAVGATSARAAALEARSGPPPLTLDQIRQALSATGVAPLNIFQLIGSGAATGAVRFGTHAQRVATSAGSLGSGALYYETDRFALYATALVGATTVQWLLLAQAQPLPSTLVPDTKPDDLGEGDAGFVTFATDFWRGFVWDGTDWTDAPGADDRGYYQDFEDAPTHDGWQVCDGSTVDMSNDDGTVSSVTVPDLITDNRVRRAAAVAGAEGGNAEVHTHQTEIIDTVPRVVLVGANNTAAVSTNTSSFPSGAGGDDANMPYHEVLVYMRL